MATKHMPNQRRNYFINKDFQARFIIKFCLLVILGGALTMGMLYLFGKGSTTVSIVDSQVVVRSTTDFLLPVLAQTVLVVVVIVGFATIAVTMLFSHKIAGPLHHFKQVMKSLGKGDFSRDVHIRGNDQLQDLADEVNGMIASVRGHIGQAKADIAALKKKGSATGEDLEALDKDISFFKT